MADQLDNLLLKAARAEFETYGVRRSNVDDIAKRAGVSRSTLYRRFPNKDNLLAQVVFQDLNEFFDALDATAEGRSVEEAVVECFVLGVQLSHGMPLLARLLDSEPEIILGVGRDNLSLNFASERIAATLQRAGSPHNDVDLRAIAEILVRIAMTFTFGLAGQIDIDDEDAVREFGRKYFARLVR